MDVANALDVSVSYFFEEMSAAISGQTPSELVRTKTRPENEQEQDQMARRETLELVRYYNRIQDPTVRKRVFELTKAVAKAGA